jgi:ABC-type dipeptide/oligopeptide/nickel transport system ATPase component
MSSETVLLQVDQLAITYFGAPRPAVEGVSFSLPAGGCTAFVGETGSGKTSSVLAAVRLLEGADITADALRFDGADLLGTSAKELREIRRRKIGMVFQDPAASWNPTRPIAAQLLDRNRKTRAEQLEKLLGLCQRVGIRAADRRVHAYPHELSGGMLQRFMIAGALLHDPILLVADEPTSALDTSVQAELLDLLDELRRERDLGMLLVSHDLGVVARMAHEVVVLFRGAVVEQGTTKQVVGAPQHPYTRSLLASTIGMHGPRKTRLKVDNAWIAESQAAPVVAS